MERRGVPGVLVVSTVFEPLARAEVRSLGLPDMRMVVMPHPIGTMGPDRLESSGALDDAIKAFLAELHAEATTEVQA
jgi:hypothetical protein